MRQCAKFASRFLRPDVALPVVRDFIAAVREKAVGQDVCIRSVTPGQMVVKIVPRPPGRDPRRRRRKWAGSTPPRRRRSALGCSSACKAGSGKTTTAAKIALRLKNRERKKVLMASLDVQRPAAQEQLAQLGRQVGVATLPIVAGERPVAITRRALDMARREGYDVVMYDTAGRLTVNEELMLEVAAVRDAAAPHQTILVADAMTGQDAVNVAKAFGERAGVTGIMLTRVDGDAARRRGAVDARDALGRPIRLYRHRREDRCPRTLLPRAPGRPHFGHGRRGQPGRESWPRQPTRTRPKSSRPSFEKGNFDLDDLAGQLRQLRRMGGMSSMLGMLPGIGKISKADRRCQYRREGGQAAGGRSSAR